MASSLTNYTLEFRGVPVQVQRKRIRHGHVRVHANGTVSLSVPLFLAPAKLEEILEARWDWILRHRQNTVPHALLQHGELVAFLGRSLTLCVLERPGRPTLTAKGNTLFMHVRPGLDQTGRKKALDAWYKNRLEEVLGPLIARWQLRLGVVAQSWGIRSMKSRWGVCRLARADLCFSLELCKKPLECIEYVVVHELAHLLESGHGPRFQAIVRSALPEEARLKTLLNGR